MTRDQTCEERIDGHLAGRMTDLRVLFDLADVQERGRLDEILDDKATRETLRELGVSERDLQHAHEGESSVFDDINEGARQRLAELPLGVSSETVFRIDLSTGGPGDWLEVRCSGSGDTPGYDGSGDPYEIDGVSYHFNDWFDHAERELHGAELATAEAFAAAVIPELS